MQLNTCQTHSYPTSTWCWSIEHLKQGSLVQIHKLFVEMMNLFALGLVLSSLVSGGFFSPPQQSQQSHSQKSSDNYVVKEKDRVTIFEFERETVPIEQQPPSEPSLLEQNLDVEPSIDATKNSLTNKPHFNPRELICDAYGKCKHKLASTFANTNKAASQAEQTAMGKVKEAVGNAKDGIEGVAKEVGEKTKEGLGKAKDSVYETGEMAVEGLGKAKDSVYATGEMAVEKTKEGLGKAKDSVYATGEMAVEKTKQGLGKAKDSVYETGEMAVDKTKQGLGKAKDSVYETGEMAVDKTKQGLGKAKDSVYETGEMAVDKTIQGLGKAKDSVYETGEMTKEAGLRIGQDLKKGHNSLWDDRNVQTKANCSSLFQRGKCAMNALGKNNAVSKKVVQPAIGVAHILALATAYGTTVWVTFVSSHVLAGVLPRQQFGVVQSKIYPVYFRILVGSIGCALGTHALRNPYFGLTSFQTYNMLVALGLVLLNSLCLEPNATRVMFEKMRLEKEEGRGRTSEEEEELVEPLVGPGRVTPAASGGTTIETETVTRRGMRVSDATTETERETETRRGMRASSAPAEGREEMRSRLEQLDKRLKNLNAISSWLNVLTLMSQTWQLVYLGGSMAMDVV